MMGICDVVSCRAEESSLADGNIYAQHDRRGVVAIDSTRQTRVVFHFEQPRLEDFG